MKRAIVAVAIAAISTTAFATGKKPEKPSKPDHPVTNISKPVSAQASAAGVGIAASSSKSQVAEGGAAQALTLGVLRMRISDGSTLLTVSDCD